MKIIVKRPEFKDCYLYIGCDFEYTLVETLIESGYIVEILE